MFHRLAALLVLTLLWTVPVLGAAPPAERAPSAATGDPRLFRLQELLDELGLYKGPLDGRMGETLRGAIAAYRQGWGLNGQASADDDLLGHVENSAAVFRLQRRIQEIKEEQIAEARQALAANPAIRELLGRSPPPRREIDIPSCLRAADVDCLLAGALESAQAESDERQREWALHEVAVAEARSGRAAAALGTAALIEDPRSVLQVFRAIAENLADSGHLSQAGAVAGIHPDPRGRAEALTSLAKVQAGRGLREDSSANLRLSESLLDKVKDAQGRVQLLSRMSEIRFVLGERKAAALLLEKAREALGAMESEARPPARGLIAAALAANGEPMAALAEMNGVGEADLITPVRLAVVDAHLKRGEPELALKEARRITIPRYRAIALAKVAPAIGNGKRNGEARAVLEEALKATPLIELVYARSYAVSRVALARLEMGDREGAAGAAMGIEDEQLRTQILWKIAGEGEGQNDAARERAEMAGEAIPDPFAKVFTFAQLSIEAARGGNISLASRHFARAVKAAQPISTPFLRARALSALATALGEMVR